MTVRQWVRIPTFRGNVMASSSKIEIPRRNIGIRLSIDVGSVREEQNLELYRYENLKTVMAK